MKAFYRRQGFLNLCFENPDSWALLPEILTQWQKFAQGPSLKSAQVVLRLLVCGTGFKQHWPRSLILKKLHCNNGTVVPDSPERDQ